MDWSLVIGSIVFFIFVGAPLLILLLVLVQRIVAALKPKKKKDEGVPLDAALAVVRKRLTELQEKTSAMAAASPAMSDEAILAEKIFPVAPVQGARNNEICNRFISDALPDFAAARFDEGSLTELSFDEICHVYNTVEWYVTQLVRTWRDTAPAYKRVLRRRIFALLRERTLYVIVDPAQGKPFRVQDDRVARCFSGQPTRIPPEGCLLLGTSAMAGHQLCAAVRELYRRKAFFQEFEPDSYESLMAGLAGDGFDYVLLNGQSVLPLRDFTAPQEN